MVDIFSNRASPRLFFLHVPKTAGTSMRLYLQNQYIPDDIFPYDTLEAVAAAGADISPDYRLYQGHFRYNLRQVLPPATKALVVLREPMERTLSTLRHLQRDPAFHPDHALAKDLTVSQILRTPRLMEPHRDGQSAVLSARRDPHALIAQLNDAVDASRVDITEPTDLDLAKQRLREIEFVGTVSGLGALLQTLSRELSFHPPVRFPLVNENRERRSDVAELPDDDIAILRDYNRQDFELYDFARDLIDQRLVEDAILSLVARGTYQVADESFVLDLGGPVPGSGWDAAEGSGQNIWRWTGGDRIFSLEVPLRADRDWQVSLGYRSVHASVVEHLTVKLNSEPAAFVTEMNDDLYTTRVTVPRDSLEHARGVCRIVFDTGEPRLATTFGHADARRLAFAVSTVRFDSLP
jgi:hypothetical protein